MNDELPDPKLRIDLSLGRVVCPLHGEAFREAWPAGFTPFALTVFQGALAETLIEEAQHDPDGIGAALDRLPCCERVPTAVLMRAFTDCGIGKDGTCDNCGVPGMGVAMRLMQPGNVVPARFDHVCFECIVFRLQPAL